MASDGHEGPCVLVRYQGLFHVLVGMVVERVVQSATISEVPGSELSMTLVRGQVIPVLRLTNESTPLILGRVRDEVIALSGIWLENLSVAPIEAESLPRLSTLVALAGHHIPPQRV